MQHDPFASEIRKLQKAFGLESAIDRAISAFFVYS
jgi:hypothetical protein